MYTILSSISIRWQVRAFAVLNSYWPNDFCIGGNDCYSLESSRVCCPAILLVERKDRNIIVKFLNVSPRVK